MDTTSPIAPMDVNYPDFGVDGENYAPGPSGGQSRYSANFRYQGQAGLVDRSIVVVWTLYVCVLYAIVLHYYLLSVTQYKNKTNHIEGKNSIEYRETLSYMYSRALSENGPHGMMLPPRYDEHRKYIMSLIDKSNVDLPVEMQQVFFFKMIDQNYFYAFIKTWSYFEVFYYKSISSRPKGSIGKSNEAIDKCLNRFAFS